MFLISASSLQIPTFTATGVLTTYNPGDRIQFPNILSNIGEHYSMTTNSFTCPTLGLYLFAFAIESDVPDAHFYVNLVKNGEVLASSLAWEHVQMSNLVFVECNPGEEVWVEAVTEGKTTGIADPEYDRQHSFSGTLLREL